MSADARNDPSRPSQPASDRVPEYASATFGRPFVSPVLVGRDAHLAALERALDGADAGRGEIFLLAGEAGIGKSRLVAEARARAGTRGFRFLDGRCFEPDRALPFAPLLDLLRARFAGHSRADLAREIGSAAPELARLLPELPSLLPGLAPAVLVEPEADKRRLFHALAGFVAGLAAVQPLLVAIEDLHWSDDTSLEFLPLLARRVAAAPVVVLLTYRSDEVGPSLGHFLAECDRGRLATELPLTRLEMADVDVMMRAIFLLDRPVRADFLHALYALTEGNPFFVEEVLTSLITAGDIYYAAGTWGRKEIGDLQIPRSVQEAVRRRSAHLSAAARQVLALAAVAGRRFDFALLQALTQRDEPELLLVIKELIAAQLVVEASSERFAFRHALTRQAVAAELLARERKALHQRIAAALVRVFVDSPDAYLEDLAYHFYEAGDWEQALAYGQRAGERAQALYAPRAAVEQFTRALDAARQLSLTPPAGLLRGRGLASETLGDFEAAQADLEAALAQATGDRSAEWRGLLDFGQLWASRDYARSGEYDRQALALARATGDPATLAHSLNRLGNWHVNVEQPLAGRRYHEEALSIFRSLHDQRGIAETLDLLGLANNQSCDLIQSAACYQQAVVLFREQDDRQGLASSLAVLASAGVGYVADTAIAAAASPTESIRDAELAMTLAREIGWRAGEAYAIGVLGACLGTQGEFGRALPLMQSSLAIAEEIGHREWIAAIRCTFGALFLDLLALPAATRHLDIALALAGEIGSPIWVGMTTGLLASAHIRQRALPQAERVLDAVLGSETAAETLGQRLCWLARAELDLARNDPALALTVAERLIVSAPNASEDRVIPCLWRLRAEALAGLGRVAEAEAALISAAGVAAAQGRRPLRWRIHLALGRLYQTQKRRGDAERAFAVARTVVDGLAVGIPDDGLRDNFLHWATALMPRPHPLSPRQAEKQAFGGLTAREREVAALITVGRSNRAIAEELVVSERTVEGHVANIFAKLGADARTQVAAWAVATGLVTGGE